MHGGAGWLGGEGFWGEGGAFGEGSGAEWAAWVPRVRKHSLKAHGARGPAWKRGREMEGP